MLDDGHMANCYLCGRPLNESRTRHRRRVKTGDWIRRDYKTGKAVSTQYRYGSRIVCLGCAKQIDAQDVRSERWRWIQLTLSLIVLFAVLLARWLYP